MQIHPNFNYEIYSTKVNSAIQYTHEQTPKYYAAIDSYNLLLQDKYFINNYSDNLVKLVLSEKNNATESITPEIHSGIRPSVSISKPKQKAKSYIYEIHFSYNNGNYLNEESIILNNFDATINIENVNESTSILTLSDIKGNSGKKNIYILNGAVENENGISFTTPHSESFLYINPIEKAATIALCIFFLLMPMFFIKKIWKILD